LAPISPLDLLTLPDDEQTVVHSLTRQPRQTLSEIASSTRLVTTHLEPLLRRMMIAGLIVEQLCEGERCFAVRFSQRRRRNLPLAFLELLDPKPDAILAATPITSALSDVERKALLGKCKRRTLVPNEVYSWQGNATEYVGLVSMGLLKKIHLNGKQRTKTTTGYLRRGEWFGLSEGLSGVVSDNTYTAMTETEVLLWSVSDFMTLTHQYSSLGVGLSRFLGHQLQQCHHQQQAGTGVLWVIESLHDGAGATTLALNLALLATRGDSDQEGHGRARVALWSTERSVATLLPLLHEKSIAKEKRLPGEKTVLRHETGLDILMETERGDYPPLVELDILLTSLQKHYDYVICDTGADATDEFRLRLRGRAHTLITMTREPEGAGEAIARWGLLKPYAPPGQRRVLTLNGPTQSQAVVNLNPAFHLVLPCETIMLAQSILEGQGLVEYAPNNRLSQAFREVYRRLSLTQTVAIFIPSTLDVDTAVDNDVQVQATLSFLGALFGGATSSDASGVWKSEASDLVVEKVSIVRSFVSEKALKQHLDDVIAFAGQIKEEMKQEAVAIDVNNELVLV
jgi:CRP-like cAMP-binding protein